MCWALDNGKHVHASGISLHGFPLPEELPLRCLDPDKTSPPWGHSSSLLLQISAFPNELLPALYGHAWDCVHKTALKLLFPLDVSLRGGITCAQELILNDPYELFKVCNFHIRRSGSLTHKVAT
jgi:hypothetical protein